MCFEVKHFAHITIWSAFLSADGPQASNYTAEQWYDSLNPKQTVSQIKN